MVQRLRTTHLLFVTKQAEILESNGFLYVCWVIALGAIIVPALTPILSIISQTIIQLVALSVMTISGRLREDRLRRQREQDHEMIREEHRMIKSILHDIHRQNTDIAVEVTKR